MQGGFAVLQAGGVEADGSGLVEKVRAGKRRRDRGVAGSTGPRKTESDRQVAPYLVAGPDVIHRCAFAVLHRLHEGVFVVERENRLSVEPRRGELPTEVNGREPLV